MGERSSQQTFRILRGGDKLLAKIMVSGHGICKKKGPEFEGKKELNQE